MTRAWVTLATAGVLVMATVLPASAAPPKKGGRSAAGSAPAPNDAEAQIASGNDLLKKKKYAEAVAAYERAYALNQDPKALYFVAKAKTESGDVAGAVRAYSEYLKKVGSRDPQRQAEAMGEVQRLLSQVGRITVRCDVDGAEIAVDGNAVATTPTNEPVLASSGAHTISASKSGFSPVSTKIAVKADETIAVSLELKKGAAATAEAPALVPAAPTAPGPALGGSAAPAPAAAPAAPAAPPATAAPASPPPTPAGSDAASPAGHDDAAGGRPASGGKRWIGWTAAGALAAGAIVTGVLAVRYGSTFEDKKSTLGVSRGEIEDAQSATRLWTLVTAGLGVAAITVVTITLVSAPSKGGAGGSKVGVAAAPGGAVLRGTF